MEALAILLIPVLIVGIFPSRWLAVAAAVGALCVILYGMSLGFVFPPLSRIDAWVVLGIMVLAFPALYGALLLAVIFVRRRLFPSTDKPATAAGSELIRAAWSELFGPLVPAHQMSAIASALFLRGVAWRQGLFRLWLVLACVWWLGAGFWFAGALIEFGLPRLEEAPTHQRVCSDFGVGDESRQSQYNRARDIDITEWLENNPICEAGHDVPLTEERIATLREQAVQRYVREVLQMIATAGAIVGVPFAVWLVMALAMGIVRWVWAGFRKSSSS